LDLLTYLGYVLPFRENHLASYKGDEGLLSCVVAGGGKRRFLCIKGIYARTCEKLNNDGIAV
jgi:hypothetical protein